MTGYEERQGCGIMDQIKDKRLSGLRTKYGVAGEMLRRFIVQVIWYTVIMGLIFCIIYIIGNSRIWHGDEPLYIPLTFVKRHWAAFFILILFVGCMIISGVHFFHFASILGKITDAVSDLSEQRVSYIKLPGQLHEVESELNQILSRMQRDRQIAKEAEQRKNDMIVYMAHDLKTPLTSIIGYLSLLQDEKQISRELHEKYLGIALRKSERLEDLINEFFEMTKYNFSNTVLSMTKVNLSVMLEQLLVEFEPMFQEKGQTGRAQIVPDLYIRCDVDKMERVFDNLFKNAMNYAYENTEILVSLRSSVPQDSQDSFMGQGVILTVQNSGKTIPKEIQGAIFEQFYRMDSSRNSRTGGSGLGLAIAKEIISLHHGTIGCESEDETITFTIYLPE